MSKFLLFLYGMFDVKHITPHWILAMDLKTDSSGLGNCGCVYQNKWWNSNNSLFVFIVSKAWLPDLLHNTLHINQHLRITWHQKEKTLLVVCESKLFMESYIHPSYTVYFKSRCQSSNCHLAGSRLWLVSTHSGSPIQTIAETLYCLLQLIFDHGRV